MIKHGIIFSAAALLLLTTTENQSWAQGFAGFHGARGRNVAVARRPIYGGYGYYRTPTFGYGVGYGNVGNPYAAVGGTTYIGGMRVGGGYSGGGSSVSRGPAPGPIGIDTIGTKDTRTDLRASSLDALNESLSQMKLPSDAGIPAAGSKSGQRD